MRKLIHIIIIVALSLLSIEASAQSRRSAENEEKCAGIHFADGSSHDFGDVERRGGDLIKVFRFVNNGDAPLMIKKITKSCSCMTADFSRKPVKPGESGEIRLKYEPHKVEAGTFHKVVQIHTNTPQEVHLITIQGNSLDKKPKGK